MLFIELPVEILMKILNYMSFKEISHLRMVSRRFNEICASMLNSTFQRLQSQMLSRFQEIKTQMPRRESARRNHPLAQESDVVETLHMRLSLLQMTFGKHIERKHVCFFAGEILDEVQRIMRYIRQAPNQTQKRGRQYLFMEDELFDLTSMAMEYFKEHIEPTLPEITYFGADFLDFTSTFATPTKRRSVSGSTSILGTGQDSPCSSRASVAGSSVSEVWSTTSTSVTGSEMLDMESVNSAASINSTSQQPPQSNMVLRKRIRRIRQGMKRYNDQLVEVKKELKTTKTKMESQTKQVHEYSQRLEGYDKKFEESSRKFQTLLTELNKCKTELQYWRSKSTTLLALPSTCASCSAPLLPSQSPEDAEAELKALANQGIFLTEDLTEEINSEVQKGFENNAEPGTSTSGNTTEVPAPAHQPLSMVPPAVVAGPPSPAMGTRAGGAATCKSGPPSPVSAVVRKRRSRDDLAVEEAALGDVDSKRKSSLRNGQGQNNFPGSGSGAKNTRFKRPKTVHSSS